MIALLSAAVWAVTLGCGSTRVHLQPPLAASRCCSKIFVIDSTGSGTALTGGEQPKWSPDHQKLIFTRADFEAKPGPTNDIWSINRNGTELRRITSVPAPNQVRFIAYGGHPPIIAYDDDYGIWTMRPNGSKRRHLVGVGGNANELAVSPDGSKLAYASNSTLRSPYSLRVITIHGADREMAFPGTSHTCNVESPSWSPDSEWIAFSLCVDMGGLATEVGIWVVKSDGSNLHRITENGDSPAWSPDGEWIAFDTWKVRPRTGVDRTAIAKIHPDGSGRELLTPYTLGDELETYENLDWGS